MKALTKHLHFKSLNPGFPGFSVILHPMDLPIFFIETLSGTLVTLSEEISKHAIQVLRMQQGQHLQLTDGKGNLYTAAIIDDHKKKCTVNVVDHRYLPPNTKKISIAVSLVKNTSRFEWFLEKATEVGVTEIIPLLCARTEKQHFRYERMRQIVISAMMQSKQVWLPVLHQPMPFKKAVETGAFSNKLIAHCAEGTRTSIKEEQGLNELQIFIGPEGDFAADEIEFAIERHCRPVVLGDTRLRTETAAVAAAVLLCI